MAASPSDYQWFNDADDDFPIGEGPENPPADTSTATAPPHPPSIRPTAGPSSRVRQLRGQPPKVSIHVPVAPTTHSRRRRRSVGEKPTSVRSRKTIAAQGKGKKPVSVPVDSEPEDQSEDDADSDLDVTLSDEVSMVSGQDKSVSLCYFLCILLTKYTIETRPEPSRPSQRQSPCRRRPYI